MSAYQGGDLDAFDSLYRQLRPILFQYLLLRTFDRQWVEDLVQESFLQLHKARRTYLVDRPVLPWALAIARHVHLMARRRSSRRAKHEKLVEDALPEIPVPSDLEWSAEHHLVRKALTRLSADQREVLLMHHVWGLSFREISGVLGIRRGAAKLRAYRGIKNLRRILELEICNHHRHKGKYT
jgi:RNA polymerase sigma-70 factor (ECF subfamily)